MYNEYLCQVSLTDCITQGHSRLLDLQSKLHEVFGYSMNAALKVYFTQCLTHIEPVSVQSN